MNRFKLVSIDLDGTLVPPTILKHVLKILRPNKLSTYEKLNNDFYSGQLSYEKLLLLAFGLLKGLSVKEVEEAVLKIPLYNGAQELVKALTNLGFRVILLTDNPDILCKPLMKRLPFSDYIATEMLVKNNVVVGIKRLLLSKLGGLKEYTERLGISLGECIHIGDWLNDTPVFKAVGFSIAVNPKHPQAVETASISIKTNDLRDLLDIIEVLIK